MRVPEPYGGRVAELGPLAWPLYNSNSNSRFSVLRVCRRTERQTTPFGGVQSSLIFILLYSTHTHVSAAGFDARRLRVGAVSVATAGTEALARVSCGGRGFVCVTRV